ncbi:MAG: hypothetical protein LBD53_02350, partial [Tannerella sp.]|nr:hypothetical protein [Tannerella sp.]
QRRRNDLEKLLSIFDPANLYKDSLYYMNINEDDFPENFRPVIRRLRMASEDEEMQYQMEMEDDYLEELREKERLIGEKNKELKEKNKEIKAQGKALQQKDKALQQKDKALEAKDKALEDLKRQLAEMQKTQRR